MAADPYSILGVPRTASQQEIKNAYRKLARELHPDLHPGNKPNEARFKEVSSAYDLIETPEKRERFDRAEAQARADQEARTSRREPFYYETQADPESRYSRFTPGDFDDEFLANLFAANRTARGTDRTFRLDISLRDAVHGGEREITLPEGKRLKLKIPPGASDGERLRLQGMGEPSIGKGPPGDAYVELHLVTPAPFRRIGNDIEAEIPISLPEAILGGEIRVPTIDGDVLMKVPAGVNTGSRLRLRGRGTFDRATGRRGDEFAVLRVFLPEKIDPELEDAVRQWSARHSYDPRSGRAA